MLPSTTAEWVIEYARSYLGTWYRFGGNSRLMGLDCSGYVCDVLRMPGIISLRDDYKASELLPYLLAKGATRVAAPYPPASILFFGLDGKPSHCAISISPIFMIEAAGGDSTTHTYEAAAAQNACVKISMISHRKNLIAAVLPNYP